MDTSIIKRIKNAGFHYIKLELEANTGLDQCSCEDYGDTCECDTTLQQLQYYMDRNMPEYIKPSYFDVYNDGSVDTELTITIPTEQAKYADMLMQLFIDGVEYLGGSINTENAGFHIAVLRDKDGVYPCRTEHDPDKLDNFTKQVKRLMPALIFLATSKKQTRSFYYRVPRIEQEKYSCINIMRGCLEYRLFDPCLDKPQVVFDYLNVIAQTLAYYSHRRLKKTLYGVCQIPYSEKDQNIYKMFSTLDNQDALRACLPYILRDKKKLQQKLQTLPNIDEQKLKIRSQIELLNAYGDYVQSQRKQARDEMLYNIHRSKDVAREYKLLSFDSSKIKEQYKERLANAVDMSFDTFAQRNRERANEAHTFSFRGSI